MGTVGAAGAILTNTTIDNVSPLLAYTSTWSSNNDTRFIGNSSAFTNVDNASVSLSFSGSAVYVFGDTVNDHGEFLATLDGLATSYSARTTYTFTLTNKAGTTGDPVRFKLDLDALIYTTPSQYYLVPASSASSTSLSALAAVTSISSTSKTAAASSSITPSGSASRHGARASRRKLGLGVIAVIVVGFLF